ncbi:acyl-CoA thioesterase [Alteribacillus persepolensis]|uniref:Acyl-CoA thioesterase n=1 Tax=Alteribacillus persepolensis TaxID=568899 RepID=A0A1G8GCI1_9BACI|nr:hotdog fold thioesterase [Alteribacillus persepolensis]SDH92001.1 acyl-CoA thioesterase [Alteribacillus persepolensis]
MKSNVDEITVHQQYKEEIINVMEKEPYAQFLGIELIDIGEGTAVAELDITDNMINSHGTVHGAITFAIADYVFAAACNSYGQTAVGLSTTVNFMAAGKKNSRLRATAHEEKKNHKIGWYKINIESDGELIATMEATAYRKSDYFVPIDEEGT